MKLKFIQNRRDSSNFNKRNFHENNIIFFKTTLLLVTDLAFCTNKNLINNKM